MVLKEGGVRDRMPNLGRVGKRSVPGGFPKHFISVDVYNIQNKID